MKSGCTESMKGCITLPGGLASRAIAVVTESRLRFCRHRHLQIILEKASNSMLKWNLTKVN